MSSVFRNSPVTCEHDNLEPVDELVNWCPDCGSQFATTREAIDRVRELFLQKLAAKYPNHPWTGVGGGREQA